MDIKFRAKRVDTGEFIYGDLIRLSIVDPFTYIAKGIGYKVDDPEIGRPVKVLPSTLGQYTGVKDKNGTEIYQGDVLEQLDLRRFGELGDQAREIVTVKADMHNASNIWPHDCKVIGNIYENPELVDN